MGFEGGAWIKYDLKGGDTEGNNILGVKGGGGHQKKFLQVLQLWHL